MKPSLERDLLKLQLKSEADLARLLRRAELQGHAFVVCCLVVTLVVGWALLHTL